MFNPYKSSNEIKNEFYDYITTIFPFSVEEMQEKFKKALNAKLTKGPYIDIKRTFEAAVSLSDLMNEKDSIVSSLFKDLEAEKENIANKIVDKEAKKKFQKTHRIKLPLNRPLYTHQHNALRKISEGKNLVVTTGTGSGKTECFLLPLINSLLKEKEINGCISDEVKAIIIYPMNALANDQMKRLREILMYYPDIKFGAFTGDTLDTEEEAIVSYRKLHSNEETNELKLGIDNELKSRDSIRQKIPHILITNYAMLERMMIDPNQNVIFENTNLKYIILDEAHVYSGAKGMETSLLIRRLLARVKQDNIKYILTSATLGKENKDEENICKFARNLTGGNFDKDSIVFGRRKTKSYDGKGEWIQPSIFPEISNNIENLPSYLEKINIEYNDKLTLKENLYDLCYNSIFYKNLRVYIDSSESNIFDVSDLSQILQISNLDEAIAFIYLASIAEKSGSNLLDARYHFFVRALEGCYISFSSDNNIFLERKEFDTKDYRVFELAVCKKCGDLSLYGYIDSEGVLRQKSHGISALEETQGQYFHMTKLAHEELDDSESDEVTEDDDIDDDEFETIYKESKGKHKIVKYNLCPKCGCINVESEGAPHCSCGIPFKKLWSVAPINNKKYAGCLQCKNGKYNNFYLGNDAATSVLATALFEQLPIKKVEVERNGAIEKLDGGKQFLIFSDNRAEAAYFSTYLDKTYEVFLRRRAIENIIENNIDDIANKPWSVPKLALEVKKLFAEKLTFKQNVLDEGNEITNNANKNAWYAVLTELIEQKHRNSLSSFGLLKFEYAGLDLLIEYLNSDLKYKNKIDFLKYRGLLNEIIMSFAYWGAIEPKKTDFTLLEEDRKYITYSKKQKYFQKEKEVSDGKVTIRNVASFLPTVKSVNHSEFIKNTRYDLASIILGIDDHFKIKTFLEDIFDFISINCSEAEYQLQMDKGAYYYFYADAFIVRAYKDPKIELCRCKKCHAISTYSIEGTCSKPGCDGKVEAYQFDYNSGNHYLNMYRKDEFIKLFVKEHTAQISKNDASSYQTLFEKNKLHALSCSTTFEMGVDLGDLETVFLRDVPPTASNYTQRSGRAGRSIDSCSYTLTYAKLSSHDFNFFANPKQMISGSILPPIFKINNPKILLRHIFDVVLGYCFKNNKNLYSFKNLFNIDYSGFNEIKSVINSEPEDLKKLLEKSFEDVHTDEITPSDFSTWKDYLIGDNGVLTLAINEYATNVNEYEKISADLIQRLTIATGKEKTRIINEMAAIDSREKAYKSQRLIEFLTKSNIIPKYGFPVDVVELDIDSDNVELSRDLSVAITEYAPGEVVIANGQKYKSRYIKRKITNVDGEKDSSFETAYFCQCDNLDCKTYNYSQVKVTKSNPKVCSGCGCSLPEAKWEEMIVPNQGFRNERTKDNYVSIVKKPSKIYSSEACYVGENAKKIIKTQYLFNNNEINVEHTENDRIMVVTKDPFYVCDRCGFAYGKNEIIRDFESGKKDEKAMKDRNKGFDTITLAYNHFSSTGKMCYQKQLHRSHLSHVFMTDVVQIYFKTKTNLEASKWVMYSVMTAILDSIANTLNIERNDINGCLNYRNDHYEIVLFDTVPGGAGHMKRVIEDNGAILNDVLHNAYNKMIYACNCDTSCYECLRSYNNQLYHDHLNRHDAANFIKNFIGNYCVVEAKTVIDLKSLIINKTPMSKSADSLQPFTEMKDNFSGEKCEQIIDNIIDELTGVSYSYPEFSTTTFDIDGKPIDADLYWEKKKVILIGEYDDRKTLFEYLKENTDAHVFYLDENFDINKFIKLIKE